MQKNINLLYCSRYEKFQILGFFIWLIAAFFFLYEFFLRTFVGSFATQIINSLSLNAETFSVLGSGYYLAYALMQIPVGILLDKFGIKKIMVFATLVCAASTFLFAHASGFGKETFCKPQKEMIRLKP